MIQDKIRILIVDDDRRMTHTLSDILTVSGYLTMQAWSADQALDLLRAETFDCVLTDIKMPGKSGIELHRELRRILPGVPVLLMTAYAAEDLIRQGLADGAIAAFDKPIDIRMLLDFLSTMGKTRVIAVVDDDRNFCQTIGDILEYRRYQVRKIMDPHTAIADMVADAQVILLDMKLNQIDGLGVLRQIRASYPLLPVMLITGYRQEMAEAIQKALDLGAYACLYKPLAIPDLLEKLGQIRAERLKSVLKGLEDAHE